ncbi:hypothetical protein Y032_0244g3535 [Ancylostoma ceylanicum]|uniref:Uncharacterized protein n=1 Tax=Ancylostoma ceylanicum TaxID=53326 RepID=A0A016SDB9_9BILA|nr:hypothetical protein Y032_0244g3535 [Ancylostoma ceylanicum]
MNRRWTMTMDTHSGQPTTTVTVPGHGVYSQAGQAVQATDHHCPKSMCRMNKIEYDTRCVDESTNISSNFSFNGFTCPEKATVSDEMSGEPIHCDDSIKDD